MNTYKTEVRIWSGTGVTPITNRGRGYCDLLAHFCALCESPDDASALTLAVKQQTKHAYSCHYSMPEYPNQNTRNHFCHYGS